MLFWTQNREVVVGAFRHLSRAHRSHWVAPRILTASNRSDRCVCNRRSYDISHIRFLAMLHARDNGIIAEKKTKIAKKSPHMAKVKPPPLSATDATNLSMNFSWNCRCLSSSFVCAITARLRCATDIARQPAVQSLTFFFCSLFLRYDKVSATKKIKTFSEKETKKNKQQQTVAVAQITLDSLRTGRLRCLTQSAQ